MKKYLLGSFAIILAIGFSAFNSPKPLDTYTFEFLPSNIFNPADSDYETLSNWSNDNGTASPTCEGSDIVCSVTIDQETIDSYTGDTPKEKFVDYLTNFGGSSETQVESVLSHTVKPYIP